MIVLLLSKLVVLLEKELLLESLGLLYTLCELASEGLALIEKVIGQLELIDLMDEVLSLPKEHFRRGRHASHTDRMLCLQVSDVLDAKLLVLSENDQSQLALLVLDVQLTTLRLLRLTTILTVESWDGLLALTRLLLQCIRTLLDVFFEFCGLMIVWNHGHGLLRNFEFAFVDKVDATIEQGGTLLEHDLVVGKLLFDHGVEDLVKLVCFHIFEKAEVP